MCCATVFGARRRERKEKEERKEKLHETFGLERGGYKMERWGCDVDTKVNMLKKRIKNVRAVRCQE